MFGEERHTCVVDSVAYLHALRVWERLDWTETLQAKACLALSKFRTG